MRATHRIWHTGAAAGIALVLGAVALGSSAPASGQTRAARATQSHDSAIVLAQDKREVQELKKDAQRLDASMQDALAQIEKQENTTQLTPAAADEVSVAVSGLFGQYAQEYQAITAQAAALHEQFVNTLKGSSGSYGVATP